MVPRASAFGCAAHEVSAFPDPSAHDVGGALVSVGLTLSVTQTLAEPVAPEAVVSGFPGTRHRHGGSYQKPGRAPSREAGGGVATLIADRCHAMLVLVAGASTLPPASRLGARLADCWGCWWTTLCRGVGSDCFCNLVELGSGLQITKLAGCRT